MYYPDRSDKFIVTLIAQGKWPRSETPDFLLRDGPAWRRLMAPKKYWKPIADQLPTDDLIALIKGLVIVQQRTRRGCGSVSPVIPLFEFYIDRMPGDEAGLVPWVYANRTNPYEPFGSVVFAGCETIQAYHQALITRKRLALFQRQFEERQQAESAIKKAAIATENLPNAIRRNDISAVKALLAKGADVDACQVDGIPLTQFVQRRMDTQALLLACLSATNNPPAPENPKGSTRITEEN